MSTALLLAAALTVALGVAHSYLGERYLLMRLFRRPDLPRLFGSTEFTTRTLRFAWHLTTLAWWGFAALLALLAQGTPSASQLLLVIGITFTASGAVALVASRGRHLSWVAFLAVGGVALAGAPHS